eukprot:gnl/TRDRNA2_/TRDRNA2_86111_c0_seq1.p1 gnl/TRDRNA2_/TRDRNA2_86111_c0~~gnl/TRDRNA2_/TRDRNA2_86111_c0_seq1.p1  ORF type:complete len:619 (-),score=160.57 gnl/TRDRNA2_/TRDRNA2_86111_c0_seq1:432-2288(-)
MADAPASPTPARPRSAKAKLADSAELGCPAAPARRPVSAKPIRRECAQPELFEKQVSSAQKRPSRSCPRRSLDAGANSESPTQRRSKKEQAGSLRREKPEAPKKSSRATTKALSLDLFELLGDEELLALGEEELLALLEEAEAEEAANANRVSHPKRSAGKKPKKLVATNEEKVSSAAKCEQGDEPGRGKDEQSRSTEDITVKVVHEPAVEEDLCQPCGIGSQRTRAWKASRTAEEQLFPTRCIVCNTTRDLALDLGGEFICEMMGLECNKNLDEDDFELVKNTCCRCGAQRWLSLDLGTEFACMMAGLDCDGGGGIPQEEEDESLDLNICAQCGSRRRLPLDMGEEFICQMAGLECESAGSAERLVDDEGGEELILNSCSRCGEKRLLPVDLGSNYVCMMSGRECATKDLFMNTCMACGEVRMLPLDLGPIFACEMADLKCNPKGKPKARSELEEQNMKRLQELEDEEEESNENEMDLRTQLLWRALLLNLDVPQASKLLAEHDMEPTWQEELDDLRRQIKEQNEARKLAIKQLMRSALKSKKNQKGQTRYINNERVELKKGEKTITTGGESAADKAATSVELYIVGIGRGGRHRGKGKMECNKDDKKGPRSNKHHK